MLGLGIPGFARPRCRQQRRGDRAYTVRERGLGGRPHHRRGCRDVKMSAASPSLGRDATRFTLPVSGLRVVLRQPNGTHDILLLEIADDDAAALALAGDLASAEDGDETVWPQLTPTDLDVFLLRLRQSRVGDRIVSQVKCRAEDCATLVDISFGIEAYLSFHQPKMARGRGWQAVAADVPGWFRLSAPEYGEAGDGTRFRLPTMADLIAAKRERDPQTALATACLHGVNLAPSRRRIEAAM